MKYERNCIVCGTKYHYCGNCSDFVGVPTWKYIYDTEECRELFKTIESYKLGGIDAKKASEKLLTLNVNIASKTILEDCALIHAEAGKVSDTIATNEENLEEAKEETKTAVYESKNKQMKSRYSK